MPSDFCTAAGDLLCLLNYLVPCAAKQRSCENNYNARADGHAFIVDRCFFEGAAVRKRWPSGRLGLVGRSQAREPLKG